MTLPIWAIRGRKCVCINDQWESDIPLSRVPMLNEILTIEATEDHGADCPGHLSFVELPPELLWPFIYAHGIFDADHFRPLIDVPEEADIEMFKKIAGDADSDDFSDDELERLAGELNRSWVGQ